MTHQGERPRPDEDGIPSPAMTRGPWVQSAVFCQDYIQDSEGRFTLIKVLDRMDLTQASQQISMIWFALALTPDPDQLDKPVIVWDELDDPAAPGGVRRIFRASLGFAAFKDAARTEQQAEVDEETAWNEGSSAYHVMLAEHLDVLEPGRHTWVVATDDHVLSKTPLWVRGAFERGAPPPVSAGT